MPAINQLPQVQVTGQRKEPSVKLETVYRTAAATMGLDPDSPEGQQKIQEKIFELRELNPKVQDDDQLAELAKQNVTKLHTDFVRAADRADTSEQTRLANMREPLARNVEARADVKRDYAPFNTSAREALLGGEPGARAKQIVDREYAPLKAFDEQAKVRGEARKSDLDAVGKVYTNEQEQQKASQERAKATKENLIAFNAQLDSDPTSKVSDASRVAAKKFLTYLKQDPKQVDGMSKTQVDAHMAGVIKSGTDNSRTDAERQSLLASAQHAYANARNVTAQARTNEVKARFGEQWEKDAKSSEQPNAYTKGPKAPPEFLGEFQSGTEKAGVSTQAQQNSDFSKNAPVRDKLKASLAEGRRILAKGTKTGPLGPLVSKIDPDLQNLIRNLNEMSTNSGIQGADTNYKAIQAAATIPNVAQRTKALNAAFDQLEARAVKEDAVGKIRSQAEGRKFDETTLRNDLMTYKFYDPETKTHKIKVFNRSQMDPQRFGEMLKEREKEGLIITPIGTE